MIGCVAVLCISIGQSYAKVSEKQEERFVQSIGEIHSYGDYKWVTSFQSADGTIYLHGKKKSTDGGRTVVPHDEPAFDEMAKIPEGAIFCRDGLFLALDGPTHYISPGVYRVRAWCSIDNLKTIKEEQAIVNVPEGPRREREKGEWFGLYFHRTILEMPDLPVRLPVRCTQTGKERTQTGGTLLATMTGNFEDDKIIPIDRQSKRETKYKQRSFVVYSNDKGKNWNYLSTIAYPEPEDPVGEGFDEPSMVRLDDGRLLCVMRTGHHTPLYACWSEDDGKTWTKPVYTGLERGCDPCLLKLSDGRLLLSYGQRFPPGSDIDASAKWVWPGQGLVKLAISEDGTGKNWVETTIGAEMGSCYSTIIEVEPNVIFCQVDGWFWRVTLRPRKDEG
nr:exo-alpha-sialidase [Deltaproteobacteria bacterium]